MKLTPERHERIVGIIRVGLTVERACAMAGIAKPSFYDWLRRGARAREQPEEQRSAEDAACLAFLDAIEQAEAQAELRSVVRIGRAAESQWQADAWFLERRFPDRWGRRERHELSGPGGGPIAVAAIELQWPDDAAAADADAPGGPAPGDAAPLAPGADLGRP